MPRFVSHNPDYDAALHAAEVLAQRFPRNLYPVVVICDRSGKTGAADAEALSKVKRACHRKVGKLECFCLPLSDAFFLIREEDGVDLDYAFFAFLENLKDQFRLILSGDDRDGSPHPYRGPLALGNLPDSMLSPLERDVDRLAGLLDACFHMGDEEEERAVAEFERVEQLWVKLILENT